MSELLTGSALLWTLALGVGAADGLYFHLWTYRIHTRPESRTEHLAHLGRAFLLPPTLWLAFLAGAHAMDQHPRVAMLVGLIAIDWALGIWDALLEKESRRALGGLQRSEYLVHLVATGLHSGAEVLAIAAWALPTYGSASSPGGPTAFASGIAYVLLPVSIAAAFVHALALQPRFLAPRAKP